jgi:arylsulfatase A-like enzyme
VDDLTGRKGGIPLNAALTADLQQAGLSVEAPTRGDNGKAGDSKSPGTVIANIEQQKYFVDVTTKVLLPRFKAAGKPFVLVFWSRDPDGTQHNQGDSLGKLEPGINGPTSMAAIRNADSNLAEIMDALESLGLERTTDIVITADHGFSTISKQSKSSPAAKISYADTPAGQLPSGFIAIDLAVALDLPLFDPDAKNEPVDYKAGKHPKKANGLLGQEPSMPDLVVAANGGSDLVYLPKANANELAPKAVKALLAQDYVSGLFVDDSLGSIPGTLPLSAINMKGSALTPIPSIVINFKSQATGCKIPVLCTAEVADTGLQQGQGMHGSFSRADTYNFMAAIGPDFKRGFVDKLPVSNADVGKTLAEILKLDIPIKGKLAGRILSEAMQGGKTPKSVSKTKRSAPGMNGLRTVLNYQSVGQTQYFDVAGFPGRSVGLNTK